VSRGYVAFPALVGVGLLILGAQTVLDALRYTFTTDITSALTSSVVPLSVGAALLLVALAVARGTRLGRLLGTGTAVLFVVAGIALIVAEARYLGEGGFGGALAGPIIAIAIGWVLVSVAFGVGLWRRASAFAPAWARADRWIAAALVALIVVGSGATYGLGAVQGQAQVDADKGQAGAEALVAALDVEVRVLDAVLAARPSDGSPPVVERLSLELTIRSPQAFGLHTVPSLCLIDDATRVDPAFKPGTLCWGGAGGPITLERSFSDLTMAQGSTTVGLELDGAASICAFVAGPWSAELTIDPVRPEDADGGVVAPRQPIHAYAPFVVDGAGPGAFAVPPCTGLD